MVTGVCAELLVHLLSLSHRLAPLDMAKASAFDDAATTSLPRMLGRRGRLPTRTAQAMRSTYGRASRARARSRCRHEQRFVPP